MTNNDPKTKQDATSTSPPPSEPSTTNDFNPTATATGPKFKPGQRVVYINGLTGEKSLATIMHYDYEMGSYYCYTIEVNGREESYVPEEFLDFIAVDPAVNKVLGILNLRDETDNYLKENYPTLKDFEDFLARPIEVIKDDCKPKNDGDYKEPRFKRSDCEEFIILSRWTKKNQVVKGEINWGYFNEANASSNFNEFREQAQKDDLIKILKELGIYTDKVVNTLKAKSVQTAAHFVQKPKSWYDKLCEEESGTEENSKQAKHFLLSGIEKHAIEKFKDWYNFHFIGYLPSDWIVSFRNDDVLPKERDLRKVLRVIGLNPDAIEALKMNDIKDIATLNRTSKEWKTQCARNTLFSSITARRDSRPPFEWRDMGLTRNDASDIISFRNWHNFYVAGKKNMKGWVAEFNSAQYNNFLQRYEPGDDFRNPSWWKFWQHDSLKFSQERHDYYDIIQKAAESGDVTDEQRYHLLKYMEKREKRSLLEEITSQHAEGLGDSTLQEDRLQELFHRDEQRAEEKEKRDLFFGQQFCQFFFSAFLVLVLLGSWLWTTVYFMMESKREKKILEGEPGFEPHSGFDYVTFIHNVLFGLVTAVIIQELGEEAKETSLYCRFLPTYREQRRRQKEYRILARGNVVRYWSGTVQFFKTFLMWVILWSTRFYIIFWICLGAASLVFGAVEGLDTSNPLYTTGQTWLGIAVTIGYSYFGLNGKNAPKLEDTVGKKAPKLEDTSEKIDHSNKDVDGSDGANGREKARFTEQLPVKAASTSKKKQVAKAAPATPSSGKDNEATSARNKKNSVAPFSSGTKVQSAPTGITTASTSKEKQAAEVTPDPPSFEGMKSLGHYKDEYGTTFEKYQATPDGNCLPYAVNGSNDFQKMMKTRSGTAQYIELNRVHYEDVFDDTDKVIAQIRNVGTQLGNEFLQVFADWTGDTIVSYVTVEDGDDRVYTFTPSAEFESAKPSGETRFVIYNNVDHHDGLRPINNKEEGDGNDDLCK